MIAHLGDDLHAFATFTLLGLDESLRDKVAHAHARKRRQCEGRERARGAVAAVGASQRTRSGICDVDRGSYRGYPSRR
jgi:hypothetical protein